MMYLFTTVPHPHRHWQLQDQMTRQNGFEVRYSGKLIAVHCITWMCIVTTRTSTATQPQLTLCSIALAQPGKNLSRINRKKARPHTSGFVFAETSVRLPWKLFISAIQNNTYRIKASQKGYICFWKSNHCHTHIKYIQEVTWKSHSHSEKLALHECTIAHFFSKQNSQAGLAYTCANTVHNASCAVKSCLGFSIQ